MDKNDESQKRSKYSKAGKNEKGWYIKMTAQGEPYPINSGLATVFGAANVKTAADAVRYAAETYGYQSCMASRKVVARHHEVQNGKTMEKLKLGDYSWRTYREVQESAEAVGCNLKHLGFKKGDRIAIFAETRAEWFIAAIGCMQQQLVVCTVYTNLSDEAIIHALNETEVSLVFTSFELIERLSRIVTHSNKVHTIVVMEDALDGVGSVAEVPQTISLIPFSKLSDKNTCTSSVEHIAVDENDVTIIMYTSGSTGTPKGVEITHKNITSTIIAFSVQSELKRSDRYLSFLPLAHIMELAAEVALISMGLPVYYSSPFTLTTNSPKIAPGTVGDAALAKPTYINAVPLILDRIIKGVYKAAESQGLIKSVLFKFCVTYKHVLDYIPGVSQLVNFLIFKKVREVIGGKLEKTFVGGAPLSPQTHNTFRRIFGCIVAIGYGATETTAGATGMEISDTTTGICGQPVLNVTLKLQNWDEGNYKISDLPNPRGEIIIGGPCVTKGYFKLPAETKSTFFEEDGERWFITGDIGEIDKMGRLKIIDRKKDLVKLKHGEYISLGDTEAKLKTLSVVDNMCVFADSNREKTVSVVVPVEDTLQNIAANLGIKSANMTLKKLCEEERVNAAVLKQLQLHGRQCGLSRYEIPAALHLANELWTPDTGLVTAAFKLRRKQLEQKYQSMVLKMYSQVEE